MLRVILAGTIGFILLVVGIWGGIKSYNRWQERRLVQRAYRYFDAGDLRAASLTARHILDTQPDSGAAARLMATLGERLGDRMALDWRRKVAQANPDSADDMIALARTALQFGDVDLAEATLEKIPAAARDRADFHAASAAVAQSRKRPDKAASEWSEAVRLAPQNTNYQLQRAVSQLQSSDENLRASGAASMAALRNDPVVRVAATRALITDGINHRERTPALVQLARDLQSYSEATLQDRIVYLDFLHQLDDPQFASYLAEIEKSSVNEPKDIAALLRWMSQNQLNLLALDFSRTLSPEMLNKWPVPMAIAEISLRLGEWKKLAKMTEEANWNQFEFLRHAYLTRALRGQGKDAAAEHEWSAATKSASEQPETAMLLLRTASDWGWTTETIDLVWSISKQPDKQKEAFQTLYGYYIQNGDTQGLYRVFVRLVEIDPNNLDVQNNLAQISLLLNAQVDEARRTAAEVHRKQPSNPAYAMTYAYSLLTKGDAKGALKVIASLPRRSSRIRQSARITDCVSLPRMILAHVNFSREAKPPPCCPKKKHLSRPHFPDKMTMNPQVDRLRDTIELKHHCRAEHVASTPVVVGGPRRWEGVVETFELVGHPEARRCYAWSSIEKGLREYVVVLEAPAVESPHSAVKLATRISATRA